MPLQATSGAASYDAFGGGVAAVPNYIEDVFSTYLYTGNGSTQTITNGIDLSTKGGLVWTKNRTSTTAGRNYHRWNDSARGVTFALESNLTDPQDNLGSGSISSFNTTGYTLGGTTYNNASDPWVSWTFRKQPKFFDVVTYTGTGSARTIAHSLGSTPGCIIVKRTDTTSNWQVYHSGLTSASYSILLNDYTNQFANSTIWNGTAPTGSVFSVGTSTETNASGGTYVAYIYASNAGGFGLTGTDNVITCGSFTTDNTGGIGKATVNLGYEPQYLLVKDLGASQYWQTVDNMRGLTSNDLSSGSGVASLLYAGLSNAESTNGGFGINSTGFTVSQYPTRTYIYIAIRRGPMKVPTDGTSVFALSTWTGSSGAKDLGSQTNGFGTGYFAMLKSRTSGQDWGQFDQLRGSTPFLVSDSVAAEYIDNGGNGGISVVNNKLQLNNLSFFGSGGDGAGQSYIGQIFRRAPGFFDEVCDTGTGSAHTVNHNLQVVPELIIRKGRSGATQWEVYSSALANTEKLVLNSTAAKATDATAWNSTTPTSSVFTVGTGANVNTSAATYVSYLFASCPGVSKVGSYTGNGTTQTIDCGFAGGARFVLIKRTDSTGDWYVYDTARGMTTLTDPYLLLNSAAAESATLGSVTTVTTGFAVNAAILAAINTNAATYIFLAIA